MDDLINLSSPIETKCREPKLASPLIPLPEDNKTDVSTLSILDLGQCQMSGISDNPFDSELEKVNDYLSKCQDPFEIINQKPACNIVESSMPSPSECRIDDISPIARHRRHCNSEDKGKLSNSVNSRVSTKSNILELLDEYQRLKSRIFESPNNKNISSAGDGEIIDSEANKNYSDSLLDSKKNPLDMIIQSEANILSQTFAQLASKSYHEMNNSGDDLLPSQLPYDVHLSSDELAIDNLIELNLYENVPEIGSKSTVKNEYSDANECKDTAADTKKEIEKQLLESERKREAALLLIDLENIAQTENNSQAVELLHNVSKALGVEYRKNSQLLDTFINNDTTNKNLTSKSEQPLTINKQNMSPDSTEISPSPEECNAVCDSSQHQDTKIDQLEIMTDLRNMLQQILFNCNENSTKVTDNVDSNTKKIQSSLEKRSSSRIVTERNKNLTSLKPVAGRKLSLSTAPLPTTSTSSSTSSRKISTLKIPDKKHNDSASAKFVNENIPVLPQKIKLRTSVSTVDKSKFHRKPDKPTGVKKGPLKAIVPVCSFGSKTPVKSECDTSNFGRATSTPNSSSPSVPSEKEKNFKLPILDSPRRTKSQITPPLVSSLRRASSLIENPSLKRASLSRIASPVLKNSPAMSSANRRFSHVSRKSSLQPRLNSPQKTSGINQSTLKRPSEIQKHNIVSSSSKIKSPLPGNMLKESNKHVIKGKPVNLTLKIGRRGTAALREKENTS